MVRGGGYNRGMHKYLLPLLLLLASCDEAAKETIPQTPQEMYDHAQALLKPNVQGQQSDFAGALEWTRRAAEGGLVQAMTDLGGIYLNGGRGVAADHAQAYRWFCKAAEQGSMEAEVFVGVLLYDGNGVPRNRDEALKHWRRAADAGIADARFRLGRALVQSPETLAEGMQLLEQAACRGQQGGVPQAATALGNLYYKGANGAPCDPQKAADWYAAGANGGDPLAQWVYAEMLLAGDPVPQDEKRGLAMLRMAAGQDFAPAMARLINTLRNCEDAADHEQEAEAWNRRLNELQQTAAPAAK